nr:MAG TPA: Tail fiber protein [Caudoviricetes sp.]
MAAVTESYVAVAAVYGSAVAVEAVKANETAWSTLTGASSAVMGKAAAKLAGLNPADYADMAAVASSSTAMAAVIGNSAALNAVVSSQTAMTAIANNKTAITAVEASAVAKNALYNSPLKTSISNIASTSSWTTRRNGKIWLISFRQTWSSGNTSMQHRSTLKDGGTVSCTASQSYNTDYRIDRFMDSITNYNSAGGIGNVCTYYFIPC